jgi:hypothetical protein
MIHASCGHERATKTDSATGRSQKAPALLVMACTLGSKPVPLENTRCQCTWYGVHVLNDVGSISNGGVVFSRGLVSDKKLTMCFNRHQIVVDSIAFTPGRRSTHTHTHPQTCVLIVSVALNMIQNDSTSPLYEPHWIPLCAVLVAPSTNASVTEEGFYTTNPVLVSTGNGVNKECKRRQSLYDSGHTATCV